MHEGDEGGAEHRHDEDGDEDGRRVGNLQLLGYEGGGGEDYAAVRGLEEEEGAEELQDLVVGATEGLEGLEGLLEASGQDAAASLGGRCL